MNVIVIGNGFDLNLELKTSYRHYISSDIFIDLLKNSNPIAVELFKSSIVNNWIDAENELKKISKNNPQITSIHFRAVCDNLMNYMKSIEVPAGIKDSYAFEFIRKNIGDDFRILDFNYTETIYEVLRHLPMFTIDKEKLVTKVHGSVRDGEIIFGVEDEADISDEHLFLCKSFSPRFKSVDLASFFGAATEIHIFGHSLGETDHPYFKKFFNDAVNGNLMGNKRSVFLYYYGLESHELLMQQISKMTSRRIRDLKRNVDFNLIDVKNIS